MINPSKKLPLHVSLDIDVLDPIEAPATGTRGKQVVMCCPFHNNNLITFIIVPAGMTLRELLILLEDLHQTGCLRAIDLVEVNPDLSDEVGAVRTIEAAQRSLLSLLGNYRGGQSALK